MLEVGTASQDAALAMMSTLPQELLASGVLKYTFACGDERDLRRIQESQSSRYGSKVSYQVLDLSTTQAAQDFQDRTFDVVILSGPPSGKLARAAVPVLRKLLSPTGKLCSLGALDTSSHGAVDLRGALESQDMVVDFTERDHGDSPRGYELVVASHKPVQPDGDQAARDQDILVLEGDHPYAAALSDALMSLEPERGSYVPMPMRFLRSSLQDMDGKVCIATLEMGRSFLARASPGDFALFKEIVRRCSGVVWISSADDPAGSVVTGLARTMRNENAALAFCSLQVPSGDMRDSPDLLADVVSRLAASPSRADDELRLDGGVLKASRIVRDPEMDDEVASRAAWAAGGAARIRPSTLGRAGRALKLALPRQGVLDDIYFEADEGADQPLLDDEVEIEVKASGIKYVDTHTPPPPSPSPPFPAFQSCV